MRKGKFGFSSSFLVRNGMDMIEICLHFRRTNFFLLTKEAIAAIIRRVILIPHITQHLLMLVLLVMVLVLLF